ncbi:putative transporter, major facilitator family [Treponema primitia ZAS-2]|uniref:Putative transporter, major facilitator family n=1 Tax=Treponema primitia (strain ATCC BAA-887 / DSM 12427 / ZAS-2) TaxID=545694 RepID=F5YPP3_TREPZ|nr:MFS transporter [Treponema primitia]AEF87030.1 putative transporter, major facilitator family [Treponema primitia ZAS-2]
MPAALSPYRLGKARDQYNVFNFFNALSYALIAGNIITLFAMRLNASSTMIGLLNALVYISYFFLPLGKSLCKIFPIVKIYSITWMLRSVSIIPLLFVPFMEAAGRHSAALSLTILGVSLFHFFRGIGLIANNPVLDELAVGPDRGSYMTLIQIINNAVAMFASFALAMLLGRNPSLGLYALIMAAGIVGGVFSGIKLQKIPEPPKESKKTVGGLWTVTRNAFSKPAFRNFMILFLLVALVSAIARIFIVVYAREVFSQGDGMVSLYTVFGGLGALMMGTIIKFLVDRIGAKPLYLTCIIVGFISLLPAVFFPLGAVDNPFSVIPYLSFLFFMVNFGFVGAEGIAQTYFLTLIPAEEMLDLGILYFFIFGIAGAGGSFLAGLFLDTFTLLGLSVFLTFKVLFVLLLIILAVVFYFQKKLVSLGSLPLKGALEIMFSYRDLRAITLLDKLKKSEDSEEEEILLEALYDSPSKLALAGLLEKAKSPRLATRSDAIRAMGAMENLGEDGEQALMADLVNNPYTTAYLSARILGNHGYFSAIPVLQELAVSKDYMLAGEAMIALAKLRDEAFRPQIERIIFKTKNPRLKMMGVEALGLYGSPTSLTTLLDTLRVTDPPPYLRDEVILAMASILDIQNKFYPLLVHLLEDLSRAPILAIDEAEIAFEAYMAEQKGQRASQQDKRLFNTKQAKALQPAVGAYMNESRGAPLSRWILELPDEQIHELIRIVLSELVLDDEFNSYERLKLLISHWAAHQLRLLARDKTPPPTALPFALE